MFWAFKDNDCLCGALESHGFTNGFVTLCRPLDVKSLFFHLFFLISGLDALLYVLRFYLTDFWQIPSLGDENETRLVNSRLD